MKQCDVELQLKKRWWTKLKRARVNVKKKKMKPTTLKLFMILRFTEWCDGTFPSRMHFLEQKKIKKGIKKWNHLYTKWLLLNRWTKSASFSELAVQWTDLCRSRDAQVPSFPYLHFCCWSSSLLDEGCHHQTSCCWMVVPLKFNSSSSLFSPLRNH